MFEIKVVLKSGKWITDKGIFRITDFNMSPRNKKNWVQETIYGVFSFYTSIPVSSITFMSNK